MPFHFLNLPIASASLSLSLSLSCWQSHSSTTLHKNFCYLFQHCRGRIFLIPHGEALLLLQAETKERPLVSWRRWEAHKAHNQVWSWLLELCPQTGRYIFCFLIHFVFGNFLIKCKQKGIKKTKFTWWKIGQVCRGVGRVAGWGGSITWGLTWKEAHSHSKKRTS